MKSPAPTWDKGSVRSVGCRTPMFFMQITPLSWALSYSYRAYYRPWLVVDAGIHIGPIAFRAYWGPAPMEVRRETWDCD